MKTLFAFLFCGLGYAASPDFKSDVDMVDYMQCGRAHKLQYLSERGLVVGLSFTENEIAEAAAKKGSFMGMTLYACPKGDWIWFNPENQMMLSHFGIKSAYLKSKCSGADEAFIEEFWKEKKGMDRFAVRVNCKAVEKLLKTSPVN